MAIGNACAIPFTTIRGVRVGQYLYYGEGSSPTWRKGVRDGYFVFDKTLDATGFDGVEDVNWENVKSVISESMSFIFEHTIGNADLTLGLDSGYTYNCTVDWGDGSGLSTVTAFDDVDATHTYTAGTYQVTISGVCPFISFQGLSYGDVTEVIQWGDISLEYVYNMFNGCVNLTTLPASPITGMEGIEDFGYLLAGCTSLVTIPSAFFSNCILATSFEHCFDGDTSLTAIPATTFTSCTLVTNYNWCFNGDISLIGNTPTLWSLIPEPTNHISCFEGCVGLTNYAAIPDDWKGL